jgi:[protein-PII] uridylyltransferase
MKRSLLAKLSINPQLELLEQLKDFERNSSQNLSQAFSDGTNVRELVSSRSHHIDNLLCELWKYLEISGELSLIAVGGYGRGELHPFSDIDLLFLLPNKLADGQTEKISQFVTLLWDIGLIVGQSSRTLKQCIDLAKQDITVVTNLMESRLLCGSKIMFENLKTAAAPRKIWDAKSFFLAKTEEQRLRYKKFDGSSYDLEPNVKSSPGGLRDIQLISWVAQRFYYPQSIFELIKKNIITKKEYYTLVKCQLFIWKVRYALHLVTGKAEDRLLFDYQKATAELLGFSDSDNLLGVEKMMKRYYRSVLIIRNISDILLQVLEQTQIKAKSENKPQVINQHYQINNSRIDAIDPQLFSQDPSQLINIFRLVAEHSEVKGITAPTLRAIRAARNAITPKFIRNEKNKRLFIEFWHTKHKNSRAIFLMKRSGVLSDYLPAFQKISGQMQYDMFHSYTVDEHTLFLLKNLIEFEDPIAKEKYPLCHQIMAKQNKPEIIYLAGLFHDIGKGRGGDHSEIGSFEAAEFCRQHGVDSDDADTISWLVANHLLMSLVAQKRDTSDPQVIKSFADLVGTQQKLELLYILTVADIRATSHSLWNSWKDSLLKELAFSTLAYLSDEKDDPVEGWQDTKKSALKMLSKNGFSYEEIEENWQYLGIAYFVKNPAETIAWHSQCIIQHQRKNRGEESSDSDPTMVAIRKRVDGGGSEIFIYSKDADDLFASLTATIAQHGLNIQGASIHTDTNGYCYDSFFTLNDIGKPVIIRPEQERLEQAIKTNIKQLDSSKIIIQKRMARQIKHFDVNTEIVFSNDEYSTYTRLDIVAKDRPGLLALLARAFKACNIRLHDARITTLGERVEDTFIISHKDNTAIDSKTERNQLIEAIQRHLASKTKKKKV